MSSYCFALLGPSFPPGKLAATSRSGGTDGKMRRCVHAESKQEKKKKKETVEPKCGEQILP